MRYSSASDSDHKLVHQLVMRWVIQGNVWWSLSNLIGLKFGEDLHYATVLQFNGRIEIPMVGLCSIRDSSDWFSIAHLKTFSFSTVCSDTWKIEFWHHTVPQLKKKGEVKEYSNDVVHVSEGNLVEVYGKGKWNCSIKRKKKIHLRMSTLQKSDSNCSGQCLPGVSD